DRPRAVGRGLSEGARGAGPWRRRVTRLRIVMVVPGFPIERDEPGLTAIVDLVERIGRVHDCRVVALRHPPARPAHTVAGVRVTALGAGALGGARGRAAVLARGVRAVMSL